MERIYILFRLLLAVGLTYLLEQLPTGEKFKISQECSRETMQPVGPPVVTHREVYQDPAQLYFAQTLRWICFLLIAANVVFAAIEHNRNNAETSIEQQGPQPARR